MGFFDELDWGAILESVKKALEDGKITIEDIKHLIDIIKIILDAISKTKTPS